MKLPNSILHFILLILALNAPVFFVAGMPEDSLAAREVELKSFDQELINSFVDDDNYQYIMPPNERKNWIKMMWNTFFRWLVSVLGNEGFAWLALITIAIVGVVGLGFALYGIFGIQKTMPVYLNERDPMSYKVYQEGIHHDNFDTQIEQALLDKNYKKAVRLLYLFTLKIFSDHKLIEWSPSKTNHDYLGELRKDSILEGFRTLSFIFEFVWYGDFKADQTHFEEMNREFLKINQELNAHD